MKTCNTYLCQYW